jgi:hypothetical protein
VPDRDLAKEVARLNLTAKRHGEPPVVTREVVTRLGPKALGQAIFRNGRDLSRLGGALGVVRALSRARETAMLVST